MIQIEEQYIVKRYDNDSPNNYQGQGQGFQKQQTTEYRAYQTNQKQDNYNDRVRSHSTLYFDLLFLQTREKSQRSYSAAENRQNLESPVDTSPIDVVKNVIDRWETKIGG